MTSSPNDNPYAPPAAPDEPTHKGGAANKHGRHGLLAAASWLAVPLALLLATPIPFLVFFVLPRAFTTPQLSPLFAALSTGLGAVVWVALGTRAAPIRHPALPWVLWGLGAALVALFAYVITYASFSAADEVTRVAFSAAGSAWLCGGVTAWWLSQRCARSRR